MAAGKKIGQPEIFRLGILPLPVTKSQHQWIAARSVCGCGGVGIIGASCVAGWRRSARCGRELEMGTWPLHCATLPPAHWPDWPAVQGRAASRGAGARGDTAGEWLAGWCDWWRKTGPEWREWSAWWRLLVRQWSTVAGFAALILTYTIQAFRIRSYALK